MFPFPILLGYPETHYRFLPGLSLLHHPWPEILTDAPRRINPGNDLPLLIMIKDAHHFPILMEKIEVVVFEHNAGCVARKVLEDRPFFIHSPVYSTVYEIPMSEYSGKTLGINVRMEIRNKKTRRVILNDNLPTLSHGQLNVLVAEKPLPGLPGWHSGDCHVHTSNSQSHVEFGAPVSATALLARAAGLSFTAVTDHSYDLMCTVEDYLESDPDHRQWVAQQKEIEKASRNDFIVLPGEEISCANGKGRNIHMISLGSREFVKGSGDGARRKWNKRPEYTAEEALRKVHAAGGLGFAAHPFPGLGWLHRFALNRGSWLDADLAQPLDGMQFWNGSRCGGFFRGRKKWIESLLQGRCLTLTAGNDSHGDFNRQRSLKIPFYLLSETEAYHFGRVRTMVQVPQLTEKAILEALRLGRSVLSEGPFTCLEKQESGFAWHVLSSEEFGRLHRLRIFSGRTGNSGERMEKEILWNDPAPCYSANALIVPETPVSYIRAELCSRKGDRELLCMTNPVWS